MVGTSRYLLKDLSPLRGGVFGRCGPTAHAVGCILASLRGCLRAGRRRFPVPGRVSKRFAKQKNAHACAERSRDPRSHFDVILCSAPQLGTSAMERGFSPSRNLRVSAGSYFGSEEKIMRKNLSFEANANRGTLNTG